MTKPQVYESAWNPHTKRIVGLVSVIVALAFVSSSAGLALMKLDVGEGENPGQGALGDTAAPSTSPAYLPPPPAKDVARRVANAAALTGAAGLVAEAQAVEAETGCELVYATGRWDDVKGRRAVVRELEARGADVGVAKITYQDTEIGVVVGVRCA